MHNFKFFHSDVLGFKCRNFLSGADDIDLQPIALDGTEFSRKISLQTSDDFRKIPGQ